MLDLLKARAARSTRQAQRRASVYESGGSLKTLLSQNDPTNSMNPGIGKTSKQKYWGETQKPTQAQ